MKEALKRNIINPDQSPNRVGQVSSGAADSIRRRLLEQKAYNKKGETRIVPGTDIARYELIPRLQARMRQEEDELRNRGKNIYSSRVYKTSR